MDPANLAKSGSEHAHQRAYFQWLLNYNRSIHAVTFAIPNGGARADDEKTRMIRGGQLKAEGVKTGVPDIMIAWPLTNIASEGWHAGLFIEMKKMQGGKVSDAQTTWRERLVERGYSVSTCFNWMEAANATARYFGQLDPFPTANAGA